MTILEMKDVYYSYDNKRNVLKNVNVKIERGKIYAVLGSSGCGDYVKIRLS